jgi:hypothetical protein
MEITEAFSILNLSIESNGDEIEKRYKKLSKIHHPDTGGTNEEFLRLTNAKDLAKLFAENKSLMIIANHVYGNELAIVEKRKEVSNQISSYLNRTERKYRSRYQNLKEISLISALTSGILGVVTNKSFPFLEMFPENYKGYLLIIAAVFGLFFLMITFRTNQLKDKIDELKEIFENKEEVYKIFLTIFKLSDNQSLKRHEIYENIAKSSFDDEVEYKSSIRNLLLSPKSNSINFLIRLVGYDDFGKILILKGVSTKMLQEVEIKEDDKLEIKYNFIK